MAKETIRYRFTVPAEDTSIVDWCAQQYNLSASLRALVKAYIEAEGFSDPTCGAVTQLPKRGRPTNNELELKEREEERIQEAARKLLQQTGLMEEPAIQPTVAVQPTAKPSMRDDDGFVDPNDLL